MEKVLILIFMCAIFTIASAKRPESRIIGGEKVNVIKHPYLVSIRYRLQPNSSYVHKCAGAIYNERTIVTAAQCLVDIKADEKIMIVVAANTRIGLDGLIFPVLKWFSHPNFSYRTVDYDIGLIVIDDVFDFYKTNLRSISVKDSRPENGAMGTVMGWGYREEFGPSSDYLEEIIVPIVSYKDCTSSYGIGEITERMICAGYLKAGGKDACQGDTGGPLVVENQLVGLVSWGRGCARPGYPTVYTFVGALKKWIDETIASKV